MRYLTFLAACCSLLLFSCAKTLSPEEQFQEDLQKIDDYLAANGLTAESTPSGLHYIITKEGTGNHPTLQSTVTVKYKGYRLDGSVFDETTGSETVQFSLAGVIFGWQEGIPLLKKGGKGTLLLPSYLAYGPSGYGPIAPNTVLLFDVELVDF